MFNPSREQVRLFFCDSWRKHREHRLLEGAEATAADLIEQHPEYHALLENPDAAVEQEFTPEGGQMNPFLHLSLHLAIADQISIDQPPGIRAAYHALRSASMCTKPNTPSWSAWAKRSGAPSAMDRRSTPISIWCASSVVPESKIGQQVVLRGRSMSTTTAAED